MCRSRLVRLAFVAAALLAGCSSSSSPSDGADEHKPSDPKPNDPTKPIEPEKDVATEIVVGIDGEDFRSQGLWIKQLDVVAKIDGVVAATESLVDGKDTLFPHELRLHPPKGKPEAAVEIEVIGRDRADLMTPAIVTRLATTHFAKDRSKLAYVFLEIRCNTFPLLGGGGPSGPTCEAPTTCTSGKCGTAELPALTAYRADWAKNPPSACGTGAPELTIQQGEATLAPLADGDTVQLEQGPQCGHHFWLSLRMKNLAQSGTITTVSATQPGTSISVPATAYPYAWGPSDGGACDLVGVRVQVDASGTPAAQFAGKPLDVKVEAKDKAGRSVTSTRHVNVASDIKVIPGRNCGTGPSG